MRAERWKLPDEWIWCTAADVARIVGGGTPSTKVDANFAVNGIPWIGPADLTGYKDTYIKRGRRDLSEKGYASSGATLLPAGTVLFSSRAPIGYCAIAANPICTNQGFKSWVREDGLSPEFVRYYLLASVDYIDSLASGTTFREVSGKRVESVEFPLPPTAEQRRIVAKLDALTARLARARAELGRVQPLAKRLREQALSEAYEFRSGDLAPISFFIASLDQGWSPKCENYASSSEEEWAVLKTTAVQALRFLECENKVLPSALAPRPKLEVKAGDVLVTRAGPRVRVGISCVVDECRSRLILADKIYRLRCQSNRAIPDYIALMLNTPQLLTQIETMKTGISDSGLNLTQEKFLSLQIPKIEIDAQAELVGLVGAAFARADRLEAEAARARALLDRLESAILAKAFRGELVPQDPNDEPASVLLERIRAERAAEPIAKRGRRAKAVA